MEQSFADLLTDAFSETAVPLFPDGDTDFEDLNFDEKLEDVPQENLLTEEDSAPQQEVTADLTSMETKDIYMADNVVVEQCDDESSEEDLAGERITSRDITLEDDYTSSEGESEERDSVSGEDEEDETAEPGDLLKSVRCSDEVCESNREYRVFAEGQPLALEGAETPQVRNEEQGESDDEVSYFERFPKRSSEMMMGGDDSEGNEQGMEEEKEEDLCDSECEDMKVEQGENVFALNFEQELDNPHRDDPTKNNLEFPEISVQNLQDLIAEVDSEKYGEKMKDFSGEEHQDAGESFADYPSDFCSCEYVDDGLACAADSSSIARQNIRLAGAVTEVTSIGRAEDTYEKGDGHLYRSLDVATGEKEIVENMSSNDTGTDERGESSIDTSSDDEERGSNEDIDDMIYTGIYDTSGYYNRADYNINWNLDALQTETLLPEDLLTTEEAQTPLSHLSQPPAEDSYSVVQRGDGKTSTLSNQGSLDDIFFFNTEPESSLVTELGQLGDDEYEEERNWEQEKKRIKAFYEFYDDSEGEGEREGRQIKVQFCADPLSQVIRYDTDSSSTEGEEEQSSAESSEEFRESDDTTTMTAELDPQNTHLSENVTDLHNRTTCTRKHKCFMLDWMLKMGLVILTGLLMFWFATDQGGLFGHGSYL